MFPDEGLFWISDGVGELDGFSCFNSGDGVGWLVVKGCVGDGVCVGFVVGVGSWLATGSVCVGTSVVGVGVSVGTWVGSVLSGNIGISICVWESVPEFELIVAWSE